MTVDLKLEDAVVAGDTAQVQPMSFHLGSISPFIETECSMSLKAIEVGISVCQTRICNIQVILLKLAGWAV